MRQFCLLEFRHVSSGCLSARFARYEKFGAVLVAKLSFWLVCFCNCVVGVWCLIEFSFLLQLTLIVMEMSKNSHSDIVQTYSSDNCEDSCFNKQQRTICCSYYKTASGLY